MKKFTPKQGQIDYTNIRYAPVINTVVTHGGKVLLVKRNSNMSLYPGYWATIDGFLDDKKSIEDKALEELQEEIGINPAQVVKLERGQPLILEAPEYQKTWLIVPVHAEVSTANFHLSEEAQAAKWYEPAEIKGLKLLPQNGQIIKQFIK